MPNRNPSPRTVLAAKPMRRIARADADARWERQRRDAARQAGYRGPLTREEASAMALAQLADLAAGR